MAVYTYDSDQIAILFGAIKVESGFADGSFCKISHDEKRFTYVVGTDGSVTRSKTQNRVAKVSLFLMQSSPLNDQLSAMVILDELAPNGAGIAPFGLKDVNGTTLVGCLHAWIEGFPEMEYDRSAKQREWTIILADPKIFVGSNPKV